MNTAQRNYFLLVVALVLLIITGAAVFYIPRIPNHDRDMSEIRSMVVNFGNYEKSIPVSGDEETAKREIQQNYSPYATAALLQQWRADPKHAPGRQSPSPWPEKIEVVSLSPQGAGYTVSAKVVMMTNEGIAGDVPVVMYVIKENGSWKIAAYQEQIVTQPK